MIKEYFAQYALHQSDVSSTSLAMKQGYTPNELSLGL